jgi:L-rhamnose mutarotase
MIANQDNVKRVGAAVGIRPESIETYRRLHADPWPEVLAENTRAGRSNYSIFLLPQRNLLLSYYEYRAPDRAVDASGIGPNPVLSHWLSLCRPCQVPLVEGLGERRWADMELIFHQD